MAKKLRLWDKALLFAADLTKAVFSIIKEDSHKSRTAFWSYIGALSVVVPVCIGLAVLPGPNILGAGLALGSGLLFAGAIKGLAALGVSQWAKDKNEKYLKDTFNNAALVKKYDAYIRPKADKPETYYVHKRTLLRDVFNRASQDVHAVSPTALQRAIEFTKDRIVYPAIDKISTIYNKLAGKKDDDGQGPDSKPPEPPGP